MNSVTIQNENWVLFQHLMLQCATSEPGTLPFVIDQLKYYAVFGRSLDRTTLGEALSSIILNHAPLGHGSEVAWALWGAVLFEIPLESNAVSKLANVEDSVVALLALDANSLSLLGASFTSPLWAALMTESELIGDQWLLAYEANVQGWLSGMGGKDNVSAISAFKFLKDEGVHFYDRRRRISYRPKRSLMVYSTSGGATVSG